MHFPSNPDVNLRCQKLSGGVQVIKINFNIIATQIMFFIFRNQYPDACIPLTLVPLTEVTYQAKMPIRPITFYVKTR
jgi:hypothetical protein